MIEKKEIQPIFVFSLPRSGSTLLQRMLATHENVSTASEPWVLLPFLYGLKKKGVYAEYSHFCVYNALQDLCKEMPNGEADYLAAVRSAMLQIYGSVSDGEGKYFLDKTPRYSLVAEEVIRTFPDGKIIYLWRSPLAIIASMFETLGSGKWKLFHYDVDLFSGMENLLQTYKKNEESTLSLRYEDLVSDPEEAIKKIGMYLDLEYDKSQIDSFSSVNLSGGMGDPTGVKKYSAVSTQSLEGWKSVISNPWRKYWCRRYLLWLGKERLSLIGYNLDAMLSELEGVPTQWKGFVSDLFYVLYGKLYGLLEFKILKDKLRVILKRSRLRKHD